MIKRELFEIHAPSGNEEAMINYIEDELNLMKVSFKKDYVGNIYNISNEGFPVVFAHMDSVTNPIKTLFKKRKIIIGNNIIKSNGFNIGADDKCGIYICLNIIKQFKNINFIFTVREELDGSGALYILEKEKENLKKISFGLCFDRMGNSDFIFETKYNNYYATDEKFIADIEKISKDNDLGYKKAIGSFSDCDAFSGCFNCVNISSGYYNAHTNKEYCKVDEMYNALYVGKLLIIKLMGKKYKIDYEKFYKSFHNNLYNKR